MTGYIFKLESFGDVSTLAGVPGTGVGEVLGHRARLRFPGSVFGVAALQVHLSLLHEVLDLFR